MPITFSHSIEVPQAPAAVFGVLADVAQTPQWLARCTGIEVLDGGPLAVGTKLRYSYREGGRKGVMDGRVAERADNQKLAFQYDDKMMSVGVHFAMEPDGAGTRLTHSIEIMPKTFFARLLSPLIRKQIPRQTIEAMESLRVLLAKGSG